jgi:hypothetical protein
MTAAGAIGVATAKTLEIRLSKLQQLFNSFDPSPFHEKELDPDAEAYIVGYVDEFPLPQPLRLAILVPADQLALPEARTVPQAIHNYFTYRLSEARRRMRFQLRDGRIALVIGLAFLFGCMALRQLVSAVADTTATRFLAEGLLILGWVAMWRPLQIFLYDWWPARHHARIYAKLSAMPVEMREAPPRP